MERPRWPPQGKAVTGAGLVRTSPARAVGREREDRRRRARRAGLQLGGGEVGLVGRVREVLGLERVARALPVGVAADAHERPGQAVARVHLDAGLVGPDAHLTTA